ncbi:MAG: phytanoyl-CoA dioxygenase family protein [Sphingomonas sp.]|uniref:phytanoyl-CoA dioxygenase family protein n=1 Tax=Sphingomonas sp. TaxID=28214 RepID=UPI0017FD78FC|nr:phytanoyl-CoA dioxygenase family protein [Sphingomonas sp.]MBA3667020.1 phytanoyl-CoA dioxygenase family protein [Sphingomonas sp.]
MKSRLPGWWKAPWWILQLATGAKSFVDNPFLGSPALNRRGLHLARMKLAHRLAWWRRSRLAGAVDPRDRAAFDQNGFVAIPDFLPAAEFNALKAALFSSKFEAREQQQGSTVTRRVAINPRLVRDVPQLGGLLRSRRWKGLMRYVASTGGEPLYYLQTIITSPDGPPDPQFNLHSDSFQPALKAWLFLTEVDDRASPLLYVAGSHRLTPARTAWEKRKSMVVQTIDDRLSQRGSFRISRDELSGLGLPEPTRFAVAANTLVVADTFGFHARGQSNIPAVRVEIWAYRRRTPFLPWSGGDPLSLPGLALRRIDWLYAITDWLDRGGWRQQHWRAVGRIPLGRPR